MYQRRDGGSFRRHTVLSLLLIATAALGVIAGCPWPPVATDPPEFTAADGINGGLMFDKFWDSKTGFDQSHAKISILSDSSNFFRCKQCHGWDRLANAGAYIDRAPKTSRPNVSSVSLVGVSSTSTAQELFDLLKTGGGVTRRSVDADLSTYDPADAATTAVGDQMPDLSEILTDAQIWDLVKFLKNEAVDTTALYDFSTQGAYPTGSKTFSNIGKDGDAAAGDTLFANNCATCHGADAALILVDGDEFTVGSHVRAKPYEDQSKVKFGHPGTAMPASGMTNAEIKDLFKALTDTAKYPDPMSAGEVFFAANTCASCHAADATGGFGPSLIGASAATILGKLDGTVSHTGPTISGVTQQNADDLAAWLASP